MAELKIYGVQSREKEKKRNGNEIGVDVDVEAWHPVGTRNGQSVHRVLIQKF
jgi:hypothetical protein